MDRIVFESIGFFCPGFTDGFERREPIQSLGTLGGVVGVEECLDVLAKLVVPVVVVAPNSRLFESTVHPLDLPVIRYVGRRCLTCSADRRGLAYGATIRDMGTGST